MPTLASPELRRMVIPKRPMIKRKKPMIKTPLQQRMPKKIRKTMQETKTLKKKNLRKRKKNMTMMTTTMKIMSKIMTTTTMMTKKSEHFMLVGEQKMEKTVVYKKRIHSTKSFD